MASLPAYTASTATGGRSAPAGPPVPVRPFFENRVRAFWALQAAGWSGYLLLRGVSSVSNIR